MNDNRHKYVHGYSDYEADRLVDQAMSVKDLLHHDSFFPPGSRILEPGCGVGAQTVTLARQNPECRIVSVDVSADSIARARERVAAEGVSNVEFHVASLFDLPFADAEFDHVFVCFVLEHLKEPVSAIKALRRILKPNGSITIIEGDHDSCYFHPETEAALAAWQRLIAAQAALGGNALVGRQLYPILQDAGFADIHVSPRMVYIDASKPDLMDSFVRKTIVAMVSGAEQNVFGHRLIDRATWEQGLRDLLHIADSPSGTFCYTFFKAVAKRQ